MIDLAGAVAVVTGGGSGIGRGTVLALAAAGANVTVADIDPERAIQVADEASEFGTTAVGTRLDVNEQDDFDSLRDVLMRRFGHIDIVMNNVGVIAAGPPEQIPLPEWERVISTNLLSVVRSNLTFLPVLLAQRHGHVVNTASTAGLFSYTYERTPYSATKAAIIALSESLALYTRPQGVGITCVCPGPVATNISEGISWSGSPSSYATKGMDLPFMSSEAVGELIVEAIRADRFLLLTHPEVRDIVLAHAADPDGFIARYSEASEKRGERSN